MNLYFIAIVPPVPVRKRVVELKEEMGRRFQARHALKSPAHITLQMPFKRGDEFEPSINLHLTSFSRTCSPFDLTLDGFDCFEPRVLFLRIKNHRPLLSLRSKLTNCLEQELGFSSNELQAQFHPHMTIATRDLQKEQFEIAWQEFKTRPFVTSFWVKSIFLLKHTGKTWGIYWEFPFSNNHINQPHDGTS